MQLQTFYDRLPRNKIELVDGQTLISGSRRTSRMVLQAILEGYGPEYILPLVNRDLLREACIEAFGRGAGSPPEATTAYPAVAPTLPVARMASELMMSFHGLDRYGSSGRDVVVRLGEDAFTPDVYVYADRADPRQGTYYFDGAPDLIIEVMHPATRAFYTGPRLSRYQTARVPEVWLIDYEHETVAAYHNETNEYSSRTFTTDEVVSSKALPDVSLPLERLWHIKTDPWRNYFDLIRLDEPTASSPPHRPKRSWTEQSVELPFAPDIALAATPVRFAQFIAWAPEAKFEWFDDCPHIGGGDQTNLHLTGLLLMTLGLTEAVGLLPAEAWSRYL